VKRERRRYPRLPCAVQVQLKDRRNTSELISADVSRHGAFVVTDSPRPERELVQLSFQLPDAGSVEVLGMVARQVRADEVEDDGRPGMGIDFFALSKEAKQVWDSFVQRSAAAGSADGAADASAGTSKGTSAEAADTASDAADAAADASARADAAPTRRQHARYLSCFLVQLRDRDRLREFFTRDISAGGMFLKTPAPDKVSDRVELIIVHPESKEEFPIHGLVVRVVLDCALPQRGVGIRFESMTRIREAALVIFIESGVNFLEQGSPTQEERIERLGQAASMVGDSVAALVVLGNALLEEMDGAQAATTLERALAQAPDELGVHQGLFKAYNMLGDLDRARRHLDSIRRLEG
jgi:Tfp pilus assembly protein PilZ